MPRQVCGSQFSISTIWVLRMELWLSGLVAAELSWWPSLSFLRQDLSNRPWRWSICLVWIASILQRWSFFYLGNSVMGALHSHSWFFMGIGYGLLFSCWSNKHFIYWAISPVLIDNVLLIYFLIEFLKIYSFYMYACFIYIWVNGRVWSSIWISWKLNQCPNARETSAFNWWTLSSAPCFVFYVNILSYPPRSKI